MRTGPLTDQGATAAARCVAPCLKICTSDEDTPGSVAQGLGRGRWGHALGQWLEHGAPTGVAKDVECLGIFPRTTPKGLLHDDIWKQWALGEPTANYTSIHENEGIVRAEIRRLAAKGYVTVYPNWDAVLRRFGNVVVSKMAAVVTLRKCGTVKLRLIVDMLRSHVNDHVRLHERIVLPRILDLISDAVHFSSFDDPEGRSTWSVRRSAAQAGWK